jgi:foldase protein PrsA
VRVNLIYQKLVTKVTKPVTAATIGDYYNAHKSQFATPASRNFRIVLTKTQSEANTALSALKKGQSWATVAKKYSIDSATKDKGGQLTNITQGQEDQTLDKVAFSAPVGKLEGPIKSQFGYYVVQVTKINPAKQQTLAQAHSQISQTLTLQSKTTAQNTVDARARKAYQHQTYCRGGYMMADCSGYKPPKTKK